MYQPRHKELFCLRGFTPSDFFPCLHMRCFTPHTATMRRPFVAKCLPTRSSGWVASQSVSGISIDALYYSPPRCLRQFECCISCVSCTSTGSSLHQSWAWTVQSGSQKVERASLRQHIVKKVRYYVFRSEYYLSVCR